jgi:hypothetical protein
MKDRVLLTVELGLMKEHVGRRYSALMDRFDSRS